MTYPYLARPAAAAAVEDVLAFVSYNGHLSNWTQRLAVPFYYDTEALRAKGVLLLVS